MVLLELYWSFLVIGFSSFGGLSMIPQISEQVLSHNWMTASQVVDIVAIAEMTPGPLGLNCATFAGMQAAGVVGAIAANLGILTPSITLGILVALYFRKFQNSRIMQNILLGVRPACLGMVTGLLISLLVQNYYSDGHVRIISIVIGAVDFCLLRWRKWSVPKVIVLSAAAGLICFGVLNIL